MMHSGAGCHVADRLVKFDSLADGHLAELEGRATPESQEKLLLRSENIFSLANCCDHTAGSLSDGLGSFLVCD